jgi:uncharacterized protein (DUF1697 family)
MWNDPSTFTHQVFSPGRVVKPWIAIFSTAALLQSPNMPTHIAFLRAINVGGRIVKMDQLRALSEALGLANVETFIASGNVIFQSTVKKAQTLEAKIDAHLLKSLGYTVGTFIRSPAELEAIVGYRPFPIADMEAEGSSLYIGFLAAAPDAEAQKKLLALRTEVDEFHLNGREFYWLCRIRFSESKITGKMLEKALGMPTTMRNVTTVRKLAAKYPAAGKH